MKKKDKIIQLYEKKELRHPTLESIAIKVGVSKAYVQKIIKLYLNK